MTIVEAIDDPNLLGRAIKDPETFTSWRALFSALFGLPMSRAELEVFFACTGLTEARKLPVSVLWLIIGRRGGKSFAMALLAVYMGVFKDWRRYLAPGERAVVLLVAADREQAKILRRYIGGLLETPILAPHVEGETADAIELKGNVVIEVATCSYRTVRGRSVCVALLDEVAFWRSESTANPDKEVWRAIRASMAQFGDASVAIIASSPYGKKGLLYESGFKRFFGKPDRRNLVWQAATKVMNPTIPDDFLRDEYEADPVSAASEYGATFRNDVSGWADLTIIEAAVDNGVPVRPPRPGVRYRSGCDPSGGAHDSFTLAIAHDEDGVAILDCLVEFKPPFNPTSATEQLAATLKSYNLHETTGDHYAKEWVVDAFAKCGIKYQHSKRDRSSIYIDTLPLFTSGRVRLLDNARLVTQFASLERKTSSAGKDRVDHGPNGHDDLCNATALSLVTKGLAPMVITDEVLAQSKTPIRQSQFWSGSTYTSF